MPSALRSSASRLMPARIAAATCPLRNGLPATEHRAAVQRQRADDGPRRLAAAGAEQPGQADHLAGPDAHRDAVQQPRAGCRFSARSTGSRSAWCSSPNAGRRRAPRISLTSRPSISDTSSMRGSGGQRAGVDEPAVAQHGDAVADPVQLVHPVADVARRRCPRTCSRLDHLEQRLDLARLQRGRRLVHDHDLGVGRDRAGQRDHLLRADAQAAAAAAGRRRRCRSRPAARGASAFIRPQSIRPNRLRGSRPRNTLPATLISGTRLTSW